MTKMPALRVTNVVKMVHGWQNDGNQKYLFDDETEDSMCPTGCRQMEERLHFITCQAPTLVQAQNRRMDAFMVVHKKTTDCNGVIHSSAEHINLPACRGGRNQRYHCTTTPPLTKR